MPDIRLCVTCGSLIDLDSPDIRVVSTGGGGGHRTTVLDAKNVAHILTTKKQTEKYRPTVVKEKV